MASLSGDELSCKVGYVPYIIFYTLQTVAEYVENYFCILIYNFVAVLLSNASSRKLKIAFTVHQVTVFSVNILIVSLPQ